MENFFTTISNFDDIIKSELKDVTKISQISTGWTNFVFDVKAGDGEYIFRFPRNNFFAGVLKKEVTLTNFLKDKITIPVTDIKLKQFENKYFTMHKKIKGESLTNVYPLLKSSDKQKIALQVSKFIYELQQISLNTLPLKLSTTTKFLEDLSKVDNEKYDFNMHHNLKILEQEHLVLNHADLNPGNILIDENFNVCGILDFAFISVSSKLNDVSRLIGRLPKDFHNIMLKAFNKQFNLSVSLSQVYKIVKVWDYVEDHYINYMKTNMPEIDIGR